MGEKWLDDIKWTADGLVPAIAEDANTHVTLMMAWMNRESLLATLESGNAVYLSRSRQRLWPKGEESGHQQIVKEIRVDCDMDTILLKVEQRGGIACHTGRHNCFYYKLVDKKWHAVEPVINDPNEIYNKPA